MVAHICDLSSWEVRQENQEFHTVLGYITRLSQKKARIVNPVYANIN
jgi:hypothetical protein